MGFVGSLVVAALLIFNFLVTLAAIVVIYYGLTLKDRVKKGEDVKSSTDALFNWSLVLAIAVGINLVVWFATLVRSYSSGRSMSRSRSY